MTPERPNDPTPKRVWVRGWPVSLTDEGEGPVVVALHGLPGGVRDWRWLSPALPGVRFIRIELPGFGGTPREAMADPGLEARARWVFDVVDALGVGRFAVVGHSFGGPLAIAVAAIGAERVTALSLVASAGLSGHRGYRQAKPMWALAPLTRVPGVSRVMRLVLRKTFERFGFRGHHDEALLQTLRIIEVFDFDEVRRFAVRVVAPTLVAWCEDDPIVENAIGEALAAVLPAGPRLRFPSGGHNPQKTRAVELGEALVGWVAPYR